MKKFAILALSLLIITSCKKNELEPPLNKNQEEYLSIGKEIEQLVKEQRDFDSLFVYFSQDERTGIITTNLTPNSSQRWIDNWGVISMGSWQRIRAYELSSAFYARYKIDLYVDGQSKELVQSCLGNYFLDYYPLPTLKEKYFYNSTSQTIRTVPVNSYYRFRDINCRVSYIPRQVRSSLDYRNSNAQYPRMGWEISNGIFPTEARVWARITRI